MTITNILKVKFLKSDETITGSNIIVGRMFPDNKTS